jgi:hypothetical protein
VTLFKRDNGFVRGVQAVIRNCQKCRTDKRSIWTGYPDHVGIIPTHSDGKPDFTGVPLDAMTSPAIRYHSDALHVIERIQYTDPMTASYQISIDDPKIFTKPWSQDFGMKLHPPWKLYEQVCEENNRCPAGHFTASDTQKDSK